MKQALEAFVVVAALLLAALVFREWHARAAAADAASGMPAVGTTSDAPVPGTPPARPAVQQLSPIKLRSQPRVLRDAEPPPPPPETSGN